MPIWLAVLAFSVAPPSMDVPPRQAPQTAVRSPWTMAISGAGSRNLSDDNNWMRGVAVELAVPIARGQWAVIEVEYHDQTFPGDNGVTGRIRRAGVTAAARFGSASHRGVFGQIGFGLSLQDLEESDGAGRDFVGLRSGFEREPRFAISPGIGLDLGVTRWLSLRALAEAQIQPQRPRDRLVNPQVKAGVAVAFGR
jgi:hypothetical protein